MTKREARARGPAPRVRVRRGSPLLAAAVGLLAFGALSAQQGDDAQRAATLAETRLTMDKWLETQQILSKERKEWQQGKEILLGRLELVQKEVAGLEEKIQSAQTSVTEAEAKRTGLHAEIARLTAASDQLVQRVSTMEADVRRLFRSVPEPIQTKLQPLFQRIPEDPATTKVSLAERVQNVLGILNELNRANTELAVTFEVHQMADGTPAEVRALYVGLAQAYFVSARGEAGIGRPSAEGWKWEPARAIADEVTLALEILQAKQSPAFVPLPVRIQ